MKPTLLIILCFCLSFSIEASTQSQKSSSSRYQTNLRFYVQYQKQLNYYWILLQGAYKDKETKHCHQAMKKMQQDIILLTSFVKQHNNHSQCENTSSKGCESQYDNSGQVQTNKSFKPTKNMVYISPDILQEENESNYEKTFNHYFKQHSKMNLILSETQIQFSNKVKLYRTFFIRIGKGNNQIKLSSITRQGEKRQAQKAKGKGKKHHQQRLALIVDQLQQKIKQKSSNLLISAILRSTNNLEGYLLDDSEQKRKDQQQARAKQTGNIIDHSSGQQDELVDYEQLEASINQKAHSYCKSLNMKVKQQTLTYQEISQDQLVDDYNLIKKKKQTFGQQQQNVANHDEYYSNLTYLQAQEIVEQLNNELQLLNTVFEVKVKCVSNKSSFLSRNKSKVSEQKPKTRKPINQTNNKKLEQKIHNGSELKKQINSLKKKYTSK